MADRLAQQSHIAGHPLKGRRAQISGNQNIVPPRLTRNQLLHLGPQNWRLEINHLGRQRRLLDRSVIKYIRQEHIEPLSRPAGLLQKPVLAFG